MRTPKWLMAMTASEYKAWVEQGIFPDRLREQMLAERKGGQKRG